MGRKRAGNQKLGSAIESLVGRMDKGGGGYRKALIVSAWERVAGAQIASHAHGAFLQDDELVVFLDSPVWATELQAMAESFRTAINAEIGREAVRSLRFTVSKRPPRQAFVGDAEPIAQEEDGESESGVEVEPGLVAAVRADAQTVRDPELREALIAARTASLRRQKGPESGSEP